MIAEHTIRDALDCPEPITAAKREEQRRAEEEHREAIIARTIAEAQCRRARQAGDTRAINLADNAYRAAVHRLLAIETGRA